MSLLRRLLGGGNGAASVSVGARAGGGGAQPGAVGASGFGGDPGLEPRIFQLGVELLERARARKAGVFSGRFYSDKLMNFAMQDPGFKVQMFRFVDAFPVLRSAEAVHDVLTDYLSQPGVKLPPGMDVGLAAGGLLKGAMSATISSQIKGMAQNFIAGVDAADALPRLRKLWDDGLAFSVDLLGESCVSEEEADAYRDRYLDLVTTLPERVAGWPARPVLERDHLGPVPRVNVSIKLSSLVAMFDPIDPEGSLKKLSTRLDPILEAARDKGVFVNFDMEQAELKDLTIEAFFRSMERIDVQGGLAMQAYLRSGEADARRVCAWAKDKKRRVTVRLVKGAYWDYETIHAELMGWPVKVWGKKWETDACFERMASVFLDATPRSTEEGGVKLALGSHNARSIAAALAGLEKRGLPAEAIELQMLYGMADELKDAASGGARDAAENGAASGGVRAHGLRVREYVPVGEMIPGMAYLVRRLLENTSNESWLRAGFMEEASAGALLARPGPRGGGGLGLGDAGEEAARRVAPPKTEESARGAGLPEMAAVSAADAGVRGAAERHGLSPAAAGVGDGRAFVNEPVRDFSEAATRERFGAAVRGAVVPSVRNEGTLRDAEAALAEASAAFAAWRDTDPVKRAVVLERAADEMARRRDELAGVMVKEAGKPWREADADVCEAIDFCRYYARQAPGLFVPKRLGRFVGELDEMWYQPRGVAAVISPWNFPLAICCGMTVAALSTGNTVVVKPAEQSPGIARALVDVLHRALAAGGHDARVLRFVAGPGETVGAALVRDPRVSVIAFTGSKAVGLDILAAAGVTPEGQAHVKRVVCEMGGKNAVIVDESADLDEAVVGVRGSAFGYAGQKCSACSRVVVVDPAGAEGPHIRAFTQRLVAAARALSVGDPMLPGTDVGPVIDGDAAQRIRGFVETARAEGGRVLLDMADATLERPEGFAGATRGPTVCIGPKIIGGVREGMRIAREEVFGPVLAVMHAASFEEALAIANGHVYKLTGGVYTRKPSHIARAKAEFRVGNLYVNRGCTGAIVGRHPFGGFGLSGVGSKAGGPEYLLQFVEPRAYAENTLRRGFAPEV